MLKKHLLFTATCAIMLVIVHGVEGQATTAAPASNGTTSFPPTTTVAPSNSSNNRTMTVPLTTPAPTNTSAPGTLAPPPNTTTPAPTQLNSTTKEIELPPLQYTKSLEKSPIVNQNSTKKNNSTRQRTQTPQLDPPAVQNRTMTIPLTTEAPRIPTPMPTNATPAPTINGEDLISPSYGYYAAVVLDVSPAQFDLDGFPALIEETMTTQAQRTQLLPRLIVVCWRGIDTPKSKSASFDNVACPVGLLAKQYNVTLVRFAFEGTTGKQNLTDLQPSKLPLFKVEDGSSHHFFFDVFKYTAPPAVSNGPSVVDAARDAAATPFGTWVLFFLLMIVILFVMCLVLCLIRRRSDKEEEERHRAGEMEDDDQNQRQVHRGNVYADQELDDRPPPPPGTVHANQAPVVVATPAPAPQQQQVPMASPAVAPPRAMPPVAAAPPPQAPTPNPGPNAEPAPQPAVVPLGQPNQPATASPKLPTATPPPEPSFSRPANQAPPPVSPPDVTDSSATTHSAPAASPAPPPPPQPQPNHGVDLFNAPPSVPPSKAAEQQPKPDFGNM